MKEVSNYTVHFSEHAKAKVQAISEDDARIQAWELCSDGFTFGWNEDDFIAKAKVEKESAMFFKPKLLLHWLTKALLQTEEVQAEADTLFVIDVVTRLCEQYNCTPTQALVYIENILHTKMPNHMVMVVLKAFESDTRIISMN